jgi:hypothetical protein
VPRGNVRRGLGFGRSPTGAGPAGAAARRTFYKRREYRQKATLAAVGMGAAYGAGRAVRRRRKAKRGDRARRDSKGRFR